LRGSLLEAARAKRDRLRGIARRARGGGGGRPEVELEALPEPEPGGPVPHGAEDGGSRLVEFESFSLYLVRGWAASFAGDGGGGYTFLGEVEYSDVGVVMPQKEPDSRVGVYRDVAEARAAVEVVSAMKGGLMLWDGSLVVLSYSGHPARVGPRVEERLSERLGLTLGEALSEISRSWAEGVVPASPALVESVLGAEGVDGGDYEWVALLEWSEKLLAVRVFLEEAWARGVLPVFVTKTSRSTNFYGGPLPDVYYLREARPIDAFTTPPRLGRGIPEYAQGYVPRAWGLREFYSTRLLRVEFYARLDPGAPILAVEAAFPEGGPWGPRSAFERALRGLLSLPRTRGYPLSLIVAHRRTHIDSSLARRVIEALGLSLERRERWML